MKIIEATSSGKGLLCIIRRRRSIYYMQVNAVRRPRQNFPAPEGFKLSDPNQSASMIWIKQRVKGPDMIRIAPICPFIIVLGTKSERVMRASCPE